MSSVIGHTIGSGPAHSSARSAAVQAPITPGISSALLTSTLTILACANGLRTTAMCTMPGSGHVVDEAALPRRSDGVLLAEDGLSDELLGDRHRPPPYAFAPAIWPAASRIDFTMLW